MFTKAIDQLASDRVSVRHGGVYALEQLSELDARYCGHAHGLLTAFVRRHAPWPPVDPESEVPGARTPIHGGVADDVGAALAVLSRQAMIVDGAGSELERVDLRDAELNGLDIPHVCFAHSNLDGARLTGAKLAGATLSNALLRKTDLSGADLRGADLTRTDLDGAILLGADLTNTDLCDASLRGVIADDTTKWPHGFTPPQPGRETRGRRDPGKRHPRPHENGVSAAKISMEPPPVYHAEADGRQPPCA